MVYNYVRKSNRGSWSVENLKNAMEESKKSSINKASKLYGIPYGTLHRYIQAGTTEKKLGRYTTVFSDKEERELVNYIQQVDTLFYGLTRKEFLLLAAQFAKATNKKDAFKRGIAGKDWFRNFRKRNPQIVLRTPEPTSIARLQGFNKKQVERFFDLLGKEIQKHNLDPTRIYNMDETGLKTTTTKPPKILSTYGKRQVGMVSSLERGTLTTTIACCNAAGSFLPPFLIFKRKKNCPRLLDGAPPGAQATFTDSGWINGDKFYDWMVFFVEQTRPTTEKKVLLLLDNHISHKHYTALQYAAEHNVVMLSIPPHTSHKLQPLDVGVYGPFKTYFEQEIYTFQKQHPGRIINQLDISRLFCPAYLKAAAPINAINAFRAAGIWSFNKFIFGEEVYVTSSLIHDAEEDASTEHYKQDNASQIADPLQLEPSISTVSVENYNQEKELILTPSQPRQPPSTPLRSASPPSSRSPLQPSMQTLPLSTQASFKEVTPAHLRPLPIYTKEKITKRNRKTQRAELLTSTPVKNEQKDKMIKKNIKEFKKGQKRIPKYHIKEKNKQIPSTSAVKQKMTVEKKKESEKENFYCSVCHEPYEHPPKEDWIQCSQCQVWTHELCTSYSGFGSYFCDFCSDE